MMKNHYKQIQKNSILEQDKLKLKHEKLLIQEKNRVRLELALEAGKLGGWDFDISKNTIQCTARTDQILGYPNLQRSITHDEFLEHVHSDDYELVHSSFNHVKTTHENLNLSCRIIRKDKSIRWVSMQGVYVKGEEHIVGLIEDITDKKQIEERLLLLNNILESSTEYSMIPLDLKWNILGWNEGAQFNYGYEPSEIIGKNIILLHTKEDIQSGKVEKFLNDIRHFGKAKGEFERVRKNGEKFTAFVVMNTSRDHLGKILGYSLISKDITEQKRLEEQIHVNRHLESEKLKTKKEFLTNMSHELRTPLNAIMGFGQLMQLGDAGPLNENQKEFVDEILNSSNHLLKLINDVLDISKIEAKKLKFESENINLPDLVDEILKTYHLILKTKNLYFIPEIDSSLSTVYLDRLRLKQVIINFLSNAIKFTPDYGTIKLRIINTTDTNFRIEVEDNGIGISPADFQKLFIEFQQLDQSITKKHAGTGLGLALTKHIVESQGGSVGVHSLLGKGSIFYAELPKYFKTEQTNFSSHLQIENEDK